MEHKKEMAAQDAAELFQLAIFDLLSGLSGGVNGDRASFHLYDAIKVCLESGVFIGDAFDKAVIDIKERASERACASYAGLNGKYLDIARYGMRYFAASSCCDRASQSRAHRAQKEIDECINIVIRERPHLFRGAQ